VHILEVLDRKPSARLFLPKMPWLLENSDLTGHSYIHSCARWNNHSYQRRCYNVESTRREIWSCESARDSEHTSAGLVRNGDGMESTYFFIRDRASFGCE